VLANNVQRVSGCDVSESTLDWATEAAFNLAREGTVGLGALLKSLSSPEARRWFLDTHQAPTEIGNLIKMLRWAMGFPSVYVISESNNRSILTDALSRKGVVWIEVPSKVSRGLNTLLPHAWSMQLLKIR
jgi:hypothetical protein